MEQQVLVGPRDPAELEAAGGVARRVEEAGVAGVGEGAEGVAELLGHAAFVAQQAHARAGDRRVVGGAELGALDGQCAEAELRFAPPQDAVAFGVAPRVLAQREDVADVGHDVRAAALVALVALAEERALVPLAGLAHDLDEGEARRASVGVEDRERVRFARDLRVVNADLVVELARVDVEREALHMRVLLVARHEQREGADKGALAEAFDLDHAVAAAAQDLEAPRLAAPARARDGVQDLDEDRRACARHVAFVDDADARAAPRVELRGVALAVLARAEPVRERHASRRELEARAAQLHVERARIARAPEAVDWQRERDLGDAVLVRRGDALRKAVAGERWFDSYESWMLRYAGLAAEEDVDILVVGTELRSTVARSPDRWRAMIDRVRERFEGELVYAANWDAVEEVPFWDALDFVGVQFYAPLADAPGRSERDMRRRLDRELDRLGAIAGRFERQVLLTEVGYKSVENTEVRPFEWSERSNASVNVEHQARAYRVLLDGIRERSWIGGIYWWKWFTDPDAREEGARGFSPRGKPALQILRDAYAPQR